jgi:hypothetical protein
MKANARRFQMGYLKVRLARSRLVSHLAQDIAETPDFSSTGDLDSGSVGAVPQILFGPLEYETTPRRSAVRASARWKV